VNVERVTEADAALVEAVARLLPQLAPHRTPPDAAELAAVVAAPGTHLLVARDGDLVLGMLALVLFRVPTGVRAWIYDVVVDESARGRGVGEALTREAQRVAGEAGAVTVELTTRPEREAANRLYGRLGFEPRTTNVYRWQPSKAAPAVGDD
jgi:ribosomal protein S18 acetylase RimI-like enzyme